MDLKVTRTEHLRADQHVSEHAIFTRFACVLLALVVLYPIELTDPLVSPKPKVETAPVPTVTPAPRGQAPPPHLPFHSWDNPNFDRDAFLASFKRQANLGLTDCLANANLTERAFSASASLSRNGRLSEIRWNNEEPLPKCVQASIHAMDFHSQAERLTTPKLEIQWRVDW